MYYTQPKLSLESNVLDPDPRGSGFKSPGGSGSVFPIQIRIQQGKLFNKIPNFWFKSDYCLRKVCFLPGSGSRYESVGIGEKSVSGFGSRYVKTYIDPNNA